MKYLDEIKKLEEEIVFWGDFEGRDSIVLKKKETLKSVIKKLNKEINWVQKVETFDLFLKNLANRQERIKNKVDSINMIEFFKSELKRLFDSCISLNSKNDLWKYCSEENFNNVIECQNQKLEYLKECLLENGIDSHGPKSIINSQIEDFNFYNISNPGEKIKSIREVEKSSAKLKLTLLYKLGIIDHLRTFESLKNNDRALSRLLQIIFEFGKPDTFQTYLSAERSGNQSSAPQNNPLSNKLKEEAEEILGKTDLTNSDLQKYYPL